MNNNLATIATAGAVILTIYNIVFTRLQHRGARYKLQKEQNELYLTAQANYQTTMVDTARELAKSSYQLADRLKLDLDVLRKDSSLREMASINTINELKQQVASLRLEIEVLRDRVSKCVCGLGELNEFRT